MISEAAPPRVLDAVLFAALLRGALTRLESEAPAINALNVFPVPDGDTGTNMAATLRAALDALRGSEATPGEVALAAARGALMGGRGNSGVILSQQLRGLAQGLAGVAEVDGPALAAALEQAAQAGYGAVTRPVEGTMLTVLRDAADAAGSGGAAVGAVLEAALAGARASLARTPDLLPVLRDAGVVDSGGQGLVAMLEGMLRVLRGESAATRGPAAALGGLDPRWLAEAGHGEHEAGFGYCTQFMLQGEALPVAELREVMGALGDSLLVVGDDRLLRIHVHALDPGAALSAAIRHGAMLDIRIENMQEQHKAFVQRQAERAAGAAAETAVAQPARGLAIVAVAAGDGMAQTARSLGAHVVNGGPTMNPSAAELLAAAEATGAEAVILLPNNANILLAARQAAELWSRKLLVVPTRSVPQGMAALLAAPPDPSADPDDAAAIMAAAAGEVRTLELTWAVRSATVDGLAVREGQALALLDESAAGVAGTLAGAAAAALDRLPSGGVQLATVYLGADAHPEDTLEVLNALRERFPAAEVELVQGGQPHYPYLISLE